MLHTNPKSLILALAVALLTLLGALWIQSDAHRAAPSARSARDHLLTEEFTAELRALRRAQEETAAGIAALAVALESLPAPSGVQPSSDRRPADGSDEGSRPPADLDGLIASLDALRLSLAAESQKTQELIRTAPAFGGETLNQVRKRRTDIDWHGLEALRAKWEHDAEDASRSQYLQSAKDLVEVYGPPSAIYRPKDGLLFTYRGPEEDGKVRTWYFRLKDGFVIEFFLEHEEVEQDSP